MWDTLACVLHTDSLWLTQSRDTLWLTVIHYIQWLTHTDTWHLTHKHFVCLWLTNVQTLVTYKGHFMTYKHTGTLWLMHTTHKHFVCDLCQFVTYKCTDICDLQRTLCDLQTYRYFVTYAHYTQTLCLFETYVSLWLTNCIDTCDLQT